MRYLVGLVLVLTLVALPSNAKAEHTRKEPRELSHEQEEANQCRGLAIGLGVAIPLIVVGLSLGIAAAAVSRSIDIEF